jgi:SAM-dependent methyltransferase
VGTRWQHGFRDVDGQADPAAWIAVLDKVGAEPVYAAYKRRAMEVLDPRPGGRYLDVGTGTGADAVACVRRFDVEVVGVDASQVMVEEATRRGLAQAVQADAHALPFAADRFDGAWADRTFQHLADPVTALAEMVRVVKPGGRVVVVDPDYATQVVDVADQDLAGRVLRFRAAHGVRNGTLAHQMGRLFIRAGLTEVTIEALPVVVRDPTALDDAFGLRTWASLAHDLGLVGADEVPKWEKALDDAAEEGCFLYSFCVFITAGRKPPHQRSSRPGANARG